MYQTLLHCIETTPECFYLIILSNMEVDTFHRLTELWQTGVGTELLLFTDNIAPRGAAVPDILLLLLLLLVLLLVPRDSELLLRCEDVAGTVLLTERHLHVADWTLCLGAISEVTAGMPATITTQSGLRKEEH